MSYWAFSALVNGITSIVIGILVYLNTKERALKSSYISFCIAVSLWSFCYYFWQISINEQDALFWCRSLMASAIFIPIFYLHHIYALLGIYKIRKKEILLSYLFALISLSISFSPLFISGVEPKLWFRFWPDPGPIFPYFLASWFLFVGIGVVFIIRKLKLTIGIEKNQLKYVLFATIIGWLGGSTNFPLWFDVNIPPFGNILISAYVILVSYAIIKYRLMDIRLAITRTGIFFFVYLLVLGIPFWIGYYLFGMGLWLIPTGIAIALATAGPFIFLYLQREAENRLLAGQKQYQKTLRQASYGIGRIKKLDTLVKLIDRVLTRSAGIEQCAVYLIDKYEENPVFNLTNNTDSQPPRITISLEVLNALKRFSEPFIIEELAYHNPDNADVKQMVEFLKPFQAEIVVPMVQSEKLLSLVLLGKKKDESIYTNDDLTVFTILASQAGLAIENCLFLEAEKERLEREGASARRESLDMLVSTMAHEIDNPIQGAIGQSEMLKMCLEFFRDHLPNETMQEVNQYCEKIESNCMRVSKIVKAVEDYSKRETGEFKEVYINAVIIPYHSLVPMIQKQHKEVQYAETIEEDLSSVWGEDIMIEEILMNMVENAYHAVIHNEGEKKVHLHIFKKDNDFIRIEVKDNGYGIAPKIKNQLFQVPTTTKGSSEGTGIGLYRIRQICELLKAKYGAESQGRGHGAVFYVEIPIYKGKSQPKEGINGK